ncbi:MAG: T9SS type A sorting domain-containing protein, partial [Bacteroidota bacterium]
VVYIGGVFANVGGDAVGNIAKVGRSDGKFLSFGAAANGKVLSLSLQDSLLYVGGEFTQLNNQDRQYMGLLSAQAGLLQPFTLTPNSFVKTFLQDSLQTLVGGEFSMSDTRYRSNTYAYDLRTNAILDWAPQTDALVTQIEVSNNGEQIYLQTSSSQPDQMLISVDRNQGLPSPNWNLSLNSNTREVVKDPATGNLYLGGTFTQINGQSRTYLAGIDPNGNLLPLNVAIDDRVEGLALQSGQLYLAGDFGQVANQNRDRLAAVDLNGNLQIWAPAHNTPVFNSLSQVEATPDRIYVAGNFTQISGEDRNHIAALHPIDGNALPWNPRIDEGLLGFQVNFVKPIGQDVMIGGQIKSSAGTAVNGLARVSALGARLTKAPFPVDYVQLQAVEAYDEKLVVGGNYLRLNDRRHAHISTLDIEAHEEQELILGPHLASYLPLKGGNEGDVTIRLRGAGFSPDTRVYLRHNGFNPIVGLDSGRVQHGDALLDVPFVLRGEAPGFRDLVIEIPGDTTIVIPNGFEIEANSRTQVYADVIGRKLARTNARAKFYIQYGNSGNIDAIGVPIWLATSQNLANVRIEYLEISILDTTQAFLDSIPQFVPIDTLWTKEYEANVHAFILPKIPAGSVGIIQFSAEVTAIGQFRMRAWANEPLYGSPLKYWTGECFDTWFGAAIGFIPFAGCAYGALDAALSPTFDLLYDPQFGTSSWATDYMVGVGGTAVGCILDFTTLGVGRVVLETVNEALTVKTTYDVLNKCLTPEDKGDFDGFGVGSFDPNDKTGRQGEGGLGWLRSDQAFPYVIRFENIDTATAPALVVEIRDTLDPTVFDLNSLQLMGFNIADSLYRFVPQRGTQNRIVDLRPRLPYYVEVTTELESVNGEFVCRFLTLDTLTMQAVDDPIGGFLPPNVDGVSGTGSIIFSLETQAAIQTGAIMENSAGIYFDTNPPIITNTWRNTIDDDLPSSQIAALADTLSDLEIPLHWSSSDIGSGVRYFDLYFREDGGPWQVAADQLSDTSFVFLGVAGSFYEFYSIAYDTALNEELPPLQADASTFIDASVGIKDGFDNNFVRLYPNPNDGSFTLSFESLKATKVKFSLFNNLGALLHQQEIQLASGTQTIQQNLNIPSGLYTLRFEIEGKQTVRKMVVY